MKNNSTHFQNSQLYLTVVGLLIMMFLAGACENNSVKPKNQKGTVVFGANVSKGNSGGRVESLSPSFAKITMEDASTGQLVFDHFSVTLEQFGSSFVSTPLEIGVGNYTLKEFLLEDDQHHVIYATPLSGSPKGGLVTNALPISVAILKDQTVTISPEVIAVTSNSTPEEFGLFSFGFTTVDVNSVDIKASLNNLDNPIVKAFIMNTNTYQRQWVNLINVNGFAMASVRLDAGPYLIEVNYEVPYSGAALGMNVKTLKSQKVIVFDNSTSIQANFSSPSDAPNLYTEWFSISENVCSYSAFISTDLCNPAFKIYLCDDVTSGYFSIGKDYFPNGQPGIGSASGLEFLVGVSASEALNVGYSAPTISSQTPSFSNTGVIVGNLDVTPDDPANCTGASSNSNGKINFFTTIQLFNGTINDFERTTVLR